MARPGERRALFIIGPGRLRLVIDAADVTLILHTPRSVTRGGGVGGVGGETLTWLLFGNCDEEEKTGAL